jgi:ribosomal protein S18 acetylase RimI-like enzyme
MLILDIKQIFFDERDRVKKFLDAAGDSLSSFRYFKTRPLAAIKGHAATFLGYNNHEAVVYGHLDKDTKENKLWLGICTSEEQRGHGYGKQMMMQLIKTFNKQTEYNILYLMVDEENIGAINLYAKFGFININNHNGKHLMVLGIKK